MSSDAPAAPANMRTRFAPSPNGPLHLGHAWAAIVAHDLARAAGGQFLLRIEDIDGARSRPGMVPAFLADLAWLGLAWDGQAVLQSARLADYGEAAARLRAIGLLYPCRCTRAEVAAAATAMGPDGPIYPGTCRSRDVPAAGAAWRLDMARAMERATADGPLIWEDTLAGPQVATPAIFGDIVLMRRDAPASYHLAATADDAADGITLVTRGVDLFAASHIHRLLQALLDWPVPRWHHHALVVERGPDGAMRKLAKRRGSAALAEFRHAGADGRALADDLRRGAFGEGILPAGLSFGTGVMETS